MQNFQIGSISNNGMRPIADFTQQNFKMGNVDISKINDFNKINEFSEVPVLEGQIQMDVNGGSGLGRDSELVNDLKTLMAQNNSQSVGNVNAPATADKLYNSFSKALDDGISKLNNTQKVAEQSAEIFASGGNIDIHSVMIASQKANLSMQMALHLQNKLIGAYKEITRMQV